MIKSLVAEPPVLEEDKVMDMDECKAIFLEHGIDSDAAYDLQDCSEGEFEEMLKEQEDGEAIQVGLEIGNIEEEKETVAGEAVKRQGTRKRLFKPSTTGSTKMRIASALVSPRKRVQTKVGTRHGENSKQQENKGTSKIRALQTRRLECKKLNFMNQISLEMGLSKRVLNYGFTILSFQISSWSIYLLSGIKRSNSITQWNIIEVLLSEHSGLLEMIITVDLYFRFEIVMAYGLSRSVIRILCSLGMKEVEERWIWWGALTLMQSNTTYSCSFFRLQHLLRKEWDINVVVMDRRIRLQWLDMGVYRD